ncbi:MAG TPA: tetratricopeptide repeat protein [Vicinamibacteria bacterium]|nr:tetratricopeptide repeat protein [Vicinamibacteria bacterium]
MSRRGARLLLVAAAAVAAVGTGLALYLAGRPPRPITVDYPLQGAVFPPEFPPPRLEWRDQSPRARVWTIDVSFGKGGPPSLHATSHGEPIEIGEIDPRAVGPTNEPPKLTPEQAAAHTWRPDPATWEAIKKGSSASAAVLAITGYSDEGRRRVVSRGQVSIRTSTDPVGAPIFYRDVPLMPAEGEKGVIQPLDKKFTPLIAWRLRNVAETKSRVVMTGLHSCANCHSVSRDGLTMGMDLDGPRNNKGLYALFPIRPQAAIRDENVIAWSSYRGKLGGKLRVAFMSQVSPDGRYVVTTMSDPGQGQTDYQRRQAPEDLRQNYYVANFKDYRFLQVFYPTRGILAWYSKATGMLRPLPGADDPRFVHANAVWSPDGSYVVFAQAEARDAYPEGSKLAEHANDPNETQIRYDLYRIPFDDGRGGDPVKIAGASDNGMSNSFPKVSPDGKWIVFVKARNGQLMRPDGQLYIVPAGGGEARRMRCNTPLMNSWHSFSPNGRWLAFSSKSRSPYTQLFLTHLDEQGNDTPAVLVENSTAANRAVNIPEFVNIPPDGLLKIDTPVTEYYRLIDDASEAMNKGDNAAALPLLKEALAASPGDAVVHNSYGSALVATGHLAEAVAQYRRATALSPDYPDAHNNLASALVESGRPDEAIREFEAALALKPDFAEAHAGLGGALAQKSRLDEALPHLQRAVELNPQNPGALANLCLALSMAGRAREAIPHAQQAVALSKGQNPMILDLLGRLYAQAGELPEAIETTRQALAIATQASDERLVRTLQGRLSSYEAAGAGGGGASTRTRSR